MNSLTIPNPTHLIVAVFACMLALTFPGGAAASHQFGNETLVSAEGNAQVDLLPAHARKTMRSGRVHLRVLCPASDCRVRSQITYERPDGHRIKGVNEDLFYAAWVRPASQLSVRRGTWPLDQYEPRSFEGGSSGVPIRADRSVTLPVRLRITDPALRRAASASGAVARIRSEVLLTEENWNRIDEVSDFPAPVNRKGTWVEVGNHKIPLRR